MHPLQHIRALCLPVSLFFSFSWLAATGYDLQKLPWHTAFFSALGNGNKRTARNYVDFYRRASFSAYKVHNFHSKRKPAEAAQRERVVGRGGAGHVGKLSVGWAAKDKREREKERVLYIVGLLWRITMARKRKCGQQRFWLSDPQSLSLADNHNHLSKMLLIDKQRVPRPKLDLHKSQGSVVGSW